MEFLATCAFGLEAVVQRELEALGVAARIPSTGRVSFEGDARTLARANIMLRAADRVLLKLAEFPARDFGVLYDRTRDLPWEDFLGPDCEFPVTGRSVKSGLSSVPACQKIVKKAIVDRLLERHRVRELPETGPRAVIEVALLEDVATLTLDTSGAGLHKRGYRTLVGEASLKETMAAGLVLLSPWTPRRPLVDPFCGTGTIAIEAAMIGLNIAPGANRDFDACHWSGPACEGWAEVFDEVADECRSQQRERLEFTIHASDIDEHALRLARQHAKAAGVERFIHFQRRAFAELTTSADYGVIVTNPPYGQRLGEEAEITELYARFPQVLRGLPTWSFFILTARPDLETIVGQAATRRRKLFNAQIECTYYQFLGPKPPDMIRGTREDAAPESAESDPNATPKPSADVEPGADVPSDADADSGAQVGAEVDEDAERASAERPVAPAPIKKAPTGPVFRGLRERDEAEISQFERTLTNNARHLRKYPSRGITCYRVYERDAPDVPLIIDVYHDRAHVFEYEREHSRSIAQQAEWFDACQAVIGRVLGMPAKHVVMKRRHRQREGQQHTKYDSSGEAFLVEEAGLKFWVNLRDYTDTGLFLDHRLTRGMVRAEAKGKRFLNLFAYTGSFTVYAAAGGAASTTTVDLSNTYLDWAQANLEANGLWDARRHRLIRSDIREFLVEHPPAPRDGRGAYDLAVVDPPTFSNSKSTETDWDVQVDHVPLLTRTAGLMSPGGVIYFSNNFRRFKLDEPALTEAVPGLVIREITHRTIPPEYRNQKIHRCWRLVVPGAE